MNRNDYIFENNVLKVMPLDIEENYNYREWVKRNSKKENWNELEFEGIELNNCTGYGANGIVFEGFDSMTARRCAVKIWLPNRSSRHYNVYFEKYLEEVQKLANLNSKEIVVIYSAKQAANGYYYSVMEWVPGSTLKNFIKSNPDLRNSIRYSISKSILATIIKCHEKNIIHGDLHTKNILVVKNNPNDFFVKIFDFGTSLLNRNNKPEYSKQRESALILETILELINGDRLNFLNFKFYGVNTGDLELQSNDVRKFPPLYVSTTLIKLVEIYDILEHNPVTYTVFEDVIKIALEAPGLNIVNLLNYLVGNLVEENTPDINRKILSKMLLETFEDFLYIDESVGINNEIIEYRMIPCYFEYLRAKQYKSDVNTDIDTILSLNDLDELYSWLKMKKIELGYSEFRFYCIEISRELNIISGRLIYMNYLNEIISLWNILNKLKFDNQLYDSILELLYRNK